MDSEFDDFGAWKLGYKHKSKYKVNIRLESRCASLYQADSSLHGNGKRDKGGGL